ncbi:hypothetical protein F5Y01DRAFT_307393 [Xylaria sp. FL0043]|nr:hypothetical protein F5Y01DRAFT_307393 [Xylaria sp. FL0043]
MDDDAETVLRANDRGTQFLIWFLFISATFSVLVRLGIKYAMTYGLAADGKLIIGALFIYLAQCIAISIATAADIGVPTATNSSYTEDNSSFLKAEYASIPLLILTLALVKWSNCAFIRNLSPGTYHRRTALALAIVVGLWFVSSAVAGLVQCALPTPWDYADNSRCIDRQAWWTYVVVLNVTTDIGLVVLFLFIVIVLQTSRARKAGIIAAFSAKFLAVGAALAQLVAFRRGEGITNGLRLPLVLNQAVLSISIITTCVPYLQPFMKGLQAGVNRVDNASAAYEDELMHLPQPLRSSQSNRIHWDTTTRVA